MNAGGFYYLMSLGAFIATLLFQGRHTKRAELEAATATLLGTYQQTVTAQAERIAVLEHEKEEMADLIQKQDARIQYLEELLLGHGQNPAVVQQAALPHVPGGGRGRRTAHPTPGGDPGI